MWFLSTITDEQPPTALPIKNTKISQNNHEIPRWLREENTSTHPRMQLKQQQSFRFHLVNYFLILTLYFKSLNDFIPILYGESFIEIRWGRFACLCARCLSSSSYVLVLCAASILFTSCAVSTHISWSIENLILVSSDLQAGLKRVWEKFVNHVFYYGNTPGIAVTLF